MQAASACNSGRWRAGREHCRNIALVAEQAGYDNLLLPSVAVRMGEMWPPQLARQLATGDQMLGGRLTINIISSDLPGQQLESSPRYRRTLEIMRVLRDLLGGKPVDFHGESVNLTIDPPRLRTARGGCPPFTSAACPTPPARSLPRPRTLRRTLRRRRRHRRRPGPGPSQDPRSSRSMIISMRNPVMSDTPAVPGVCVHASQNAHANGPDLSV